MSIPDFQSTMLPLLEFASDGKEHKLSDTIELLVKMGYGGSLVDAGMAIGKTGDEGIVLFACQCEGRPSRWGTVSRLRD